MRCGRCVLFCVTLCRASAPASVLVARRWEVCALQPGLSCAGLHCCVLLRGYVWLKHGAFTPLRAIQSLAVVDVSSLCSSAQHRFRCVCAELQFPARPPWRGLWRVLPRSSEFCITLTPAGVSSSGVAGINGLELRSMLVSA